MQINFPRKRVVKEYSVIPLGFAKVLADLDSRPVRKFLDFKLSIYNTHKKKFLRLLLKLRLFKKIKIHSFEDIDTIFLSSRIKLFDFKGGALYTFQNNQKRKQLQENYNLLKKYIDYDVVLNFKRDYIEEKIIFPEEKLENSDIENSFATISDLYNKTKRKINFKSYLRLLGHYHNVDIDSLALKQIKSKTEEYFSVICHGDFCRLNLIKFQGKTHILDIEGLKRGDPLEDFVRFFLAEYLLSGKINHRLFNSVRKLLIEKINIKGSDFNYFLKNHIVLLKFDKEKKEKIRYGVELEKMGYMLEWP